MCDLLTCPQCRQEGSLGLNTVFLQCDSISVSPPGKCCFTCKSHRSGRKITGKLEGTGGPSAAHPPARHWASEQRSLFLLLWLHCTVPFSDHTESRGQRCSVKTFFLPSAAADGQEGRPLGGLARGCDPGAPTQPTPRHLSGGPTTPVGERRRCSLRSDGAEISLLGVHSAAACTVAVLSLTGEPLRHQGSPGAVHLRTAHRRAHSPAA